MSVYNFEGNKQTKQNIFFCLCRFSMSPQVHVKHALKITCSCKSSETPSIQSDLLGSTLLSVSVVFYYNTTASVSLGLLWQHHQNLCDVIRMRHNTTVEDIEALVCLLPNRCQVSAPHWCWFVWSHFPSLPDFKNGGLEFCEGLALMTHRVTPLTICCMLSVDMQSHFRTIQNPNGAGTRYYNLMGNPENRAELRGKGL